MTIVLLVAYIVFFSSVHKEPIHVLSVVPSLEVCDRTVSDLTTKAEKDPEVMGYTLECIVVPTKT